MKNVMKIYSGKLFLKEEMITGEFSNKEEMEMLFDDFSGWVLKDDKCYCLLIDLDISEEIPQTIFYWNKEIGYADIIEDSLEMEAFIEKVFN